MFQTIENKVSARIYGKGRGWSFCQKDLAADYRGMIPMFFRQPPAWQDILDKLRTLEQRMNALEIES